MTGQVSGWLIEKILNMAPIQMVVALRKRVLRANAKAKLRWHGVFSKREGRVVHLFLSETVEGAGGRREVFLDAAGVHDCAQACIRTKSLGERLVSVAAGTYAAFIARVRQLGVRIPVPENMARIGAEIESVLDAFDAAYADHLSARAGGVCLPAKTLGQDVMLPLERSAQSLRQAIAQGNVDRIQHLAVFDIEAFHFEPLSASGSLFALAARSGSAQVLRELTLAIPPESLGKPHFEGAVAAAYAGGDAGMFLAVCRCLGERSFMGAQPLLLSLLLAGDREALRVLIDAMRFQPGWGGALAVKALQHAIADALMLAAAPESVRVQRLCAALAKQIDAFAGEGSARSSMLQQLRAELERIPLDGALRAAMGQRAVEASAWVFQQLASVPKRFDIVAHLLQAYRVHGLAVVRAFMDAAGVCRYVDQPVLYEQGQRVTLLRRSAEEENEGAVRLLVQSYGACPHTKCADGRSALEVSKSQAMRSLLQRLAAASKPSRSRSAFAAPVSVDFTKSRLAVL